MLTENKSTATLTKMNLFKYRGDHNQLSFMIACTRIGKKLQPDCLLTLAAAGGIPELVPTAAPCYKRVILTEHECIY